MNREIYATDGEYKIAPLSENDRENYAKSQKQLNANSLFSDPICKDYMWKQALGDDDFKIFVIFDGNDEYCGSIELPNPQSETPELGINILESKQNKGIAPRTIKLFAEKLYSEKPFKYFIIKISSENTHSKYVFEKLGAVYSDTVENDFNLFIKKIRKEMKGVELSRDTLNDIEKIFGENAETETVYEYKLYPSALF